MHLQAIVRGVCAIIDAFHFDISSQPPDLEEGVQGAEGAGEQEEAVQQDEGAAASSQAEAESAHRAIQSALTRRVLPGLRAQLVHDGEVSCGMHDLNSPETVTACPHQPVFAPCRCALSDAAATSAGSIISAGACYLVPTHDGSVLAFCT